MNSDTLVPVLVPRDLDVCPATFGRASWYPVWHHACVRVLFSCLPVASTLAIMHACTGQHRIKKTEGVGSELGGVGVLLGKSVVVENEGRRMESIGNMRYPWRLANVGIIIRQPETMIPIVRWWHVHLRRTSGMQ